MEMKRRAGDVLSVYLDGADVDTGGKNCSSEVVRMHDGRGTTEFYTALSQRHVKDIGTDLVSEPADGCSRFHCERCPEENTDDEGGAERHMCRRPSKGGGSGVDARNGHILVQGTLTHSDL